MDNSALSATENNIRMQEQENVVQDYMGRELTADGKKTLLLEESRLIRLQVDRLSSWSTRQENNLKQLQQEQKLAWYHLLGEEPDFSELTGLSNDILKKIFY